MPMTNSDVKVSDYEVLLEMDGLKNVYIDRYYYLIMKNYIYTIL